MAVDTTQLTSIYNTLSADVKATLDEQWDSRRLRGADYANVVAQTITALIQTSAQLLQDDDVKKAQASLIAKQELTEIEKAKLTIRQTAMYDDNLRVEEAKALKDVTGMYGVGGTALPTDTTTGVSLSQVMIDAINRITP